MAEQLFFERERVENIAGRFDSDAQVIRQALEKLNGKVEELRSAWKGEAATAFLKEYEMAEPGMRAVYMEIHEMSLKLRKAIAIINQSDQDSAGGMAGINLK